jgi:hypothetical protein
MFGLFFGLSPIEVVIYALAMLYVLLVPFYIRSRRGKKFVTKLGRVMFDWTEPLPMGLRAVVHGIVGGLILGCLIMGPILILLSLL